MDPFGALIGLAGVASQSSHQNMQTALEWLNLQWQKQRASKQDRFAQAARTDVYGNKQYYDEATNTWKNELTPTQGQIIKAGEKEQLLSLTEDATRNRDIKRQQRERGKGAAEDFNRALAGFRYDQPQDDRSIRAELTRLGSSGAEAGRKGGQAESIRAALRANQGGLIPQIIKTTDDASGQGLPDILQKARAQAVQEAASKRVQHDSRYLPEMDKFQQLMDMGDGMPQKFSNLPEVNNNIQGQQAQMILSAMQNGTAGVGGAYNQLAAAAGKAPSFGNLSSFLDGGGQNRRAAATKRSYNLVDNEGSSVGTNIADPTDSQRIDLFQNGTF